MKRLWITLVSIPMFIGLVCGIIIWTFHAGYMSAGKWVEKHILS